MSIIFIFIVIFYCLLIHQVSLPLRAQTETWIVRYTQTRRYTLRRKILRVPPLFGLGVPCPHFSGNLIQNYAVIKGDLDTKKYTETVFGRRSGRNVLHPELV